MWRVVVYLSPGLPSPMMSHGAEEGEPDAVSFPSAVLFGPPWGQLPEETREAAMRVIISHDSFGAFLTSTPPWPTPSATGEPWSGHSVASKQKREKKEGRELLFALGAFAGLALGNLASWSFALGSLCLGSSAFLAWLWEILLDWLDDVDDQHVFLGN